MRVNKYNWKQGKLPKKLSVKTTIYTLPLYSLVTMSYNDIHRTYLQGIAQIIHAGLARMMINVDISKILEIINDGQAQPNGMMPPTQQPGQWPGAPGGFGAMNNMMGSRCIERKKGGAQCEKMAMPNSNICTTHDKARQKKTQAPFGQFGFNQAPFGQPGAPFGQPAGFPGMQQPGAPSPFGQPNMQQPGAPSPFGQPNMQQPGAPSPFGQPNMQQPGAPSPFGQPTGFPGQPSPFGQPNMQQPGAAPSPFGQPNMQQPGAPSPFQQPGQIQGTHTQQTQVLAEIQGRNGYFIHPKGNFVVVKLSNDRLGVVGKYDNGNYFPLSEGDITVARAFLTIMKLANPADIWSQPMEMPAEHKPFDPAALTQLAQPNGLPTQPNGFPGQPSAFPGQPTGFPGQPNGLPTQPNGFPGQQNAASPFPAPLQQTPVPGNIFPTPGAPKQQSPFPPQPNGFPAPLQQTNAAPSPFPPQPNGFPSQPNGLPTQPNGFPSQPAPLQQTNAAPSPFPPQPNGFPSQPNGLSTQPGAFPPQPNGFPAPFQQATAAPQQPSPQVQQPIPTPNQQTNGFSVQAAVQEPSAQQLPNPKEEKVAVQQSNAQVGAPDTTINIPTQSS